MTVTQQLQEPQKLTAVEVRIPIHPALHTAGLTPDFPATGTCPAGSAAVDVPVHRVVMQALSKCLEAAGGVTQPRLHSFEEMLASAPREVRVGQLLAVDVASFTIQERRSQRQRRTDNLVRNAVSNEVEAEREPPN